MRHLFLIDQYVLKTCLSAVPFKIYFCYDIQSRHLGVPGDYFQGFTLEDATGLFVKGDVDVHSVYATALPMLHPSFSLQQVLEMSEKWRSRPLPKGPVSLFIGILSASNHFAERMAVRKTWMQTPEIKSSEAVARFFVALVSKLSIQINNICS